MFFCPKMFPVYLSHKTAYSKYCVVSIPCYNKILFYLKLNCMRIWLASVHTENWAGQFLGAREKMNHWTHFKSSHKLDVSILYFCFSLVVNGIHHWNDAYPLLTHFIAWVWEVEAFLWSCIYKFNYLQCNTISVIML